MIYFPGFKLYWKSYKSGLAKKVSSWTKKKNFKGVSKLTLSDIASFYTQAVYDHWYRIQHSVIPIALARHLNCPAWLVVHIPV